MGAPEKWPLGRIIKVHIGSNAAVRVVTVKTTTGEYKRHVTRLCPLILPEINNGLLDTTVHTT